MEDLNTLWQKVLQKLEVSVSSVAFELWLKPLEALDFVDNTLIVVVQNTTAKNQIIKNHQRQLEEVIRVVFNEETKFELITPEEKELFIQEQEETADENLNDEERFEFNSKYTFENFVVGKSNQFVYAGARAVAENPGKKFNPLFIYGGVGLGKTHLLHAIGNYIKHFSPHLRIKYVTCEKFTNDYIESMLSRDEESKMEFREKYRNVDVLMVDDIQFLSKKEGTQEEFFHTFNDLHQNNKQIILTSDRPPKEIATLAERLASRFSSGRWIPPALTPSAILYMNTPIKPRWTLQGKTGAAAALLPPRSCRLISSATASVPYSKISSARNTSWTRPQPPMLCMR